MVADQLDLPEPIITRKPIVFVLDASGLSTAQLSALNDGLERFQLVAKEAFAEYPLRIDVAVVTVAGSVTTGEFETLDDWTPPTLHGGDGAPTGEAILEAIELIEDRKETYRVDGTSYHLPELWFLASASATDMAQGDQMWTRVQKHLEVGTTDNHLSFVPARVGDAGLETVADLCAVVDTPLIELDDDESAFDAYFEFVADSPRRYRPIDSPLSMHRVLDDVDTLSVVE